MCAGELIFLGKVPSFVKLGNIGLASFPSSIAGWGPEGNHPGRDGSCFLFFFAFFLGRSSLLRYGKACHPSFISPIFFARGASALLLS